jgi:hypothetical protein
MLMFHTHADHDVALSRFQLVRDLGFLPAAPSTDHVPAMSPYQTVRDLEFLNATPMLTMTWPCPVLSEYVILDSHLPHPR